ncbi:MAG: prefoldin subunit [Candidatus Thalassarchaeaceae archaeon]|jgi:chaperonin cofactor prefoldin|nr:prefoldin subunit [Candidatus Thalassarchaeaceae archaeon]MDP6920599.1 prefoldin subunit [Candidatus Thalassarchaeum sp.]MEE2606384.1 prefoldin subunit [Candidatus Thermoplasmatota archaeon]
MTDEEVSVQDLQGVAQELQLVRSQLQAVTAQVNEISLTIEALGTQDPSRPVYRAVGNLLLEVEDRETLAKELGESKSAFDSHAGRLADRESALVSNYEEMAKSFESQ